MLQKLIILLKFHVKTADKRIERYYNKRKNGGFSFCKKSQKLTIVGGKGRKMGLAASQARFLAITSRKMNCEFQSMQIAQQKLSVTRDLQKAAQDYQNNLSATKLVWEDMDENTYDLTYDMMMTPTAINQYDPYLLTDTKGKIVMSKGMFNAAVQAGMIDENGNPISSATHPSEEGRNNFIKELGANGAITGANASAVLNNKNLGWTKSGIGGEVYDKSIAYGLNTYAFTNYMKTATYEEDVVDGSVTHKKGDSIYNANLSSLFHITKTNGDGTTSVVQQGLSCGKLVYSTALDTGKSGNDTQYVITKDGAALSKTDLERLTLGDILSGKYEISTGNANGDLEKAGEEFLKIFAEVLGMGCEPEKFQGLNVDDEAKDALDIAYELTKYDCLQNTSDSNKGNVADNASESQNFNCIIKGSNHSSLSLTNLLKTYLTNFAISLDGWSDSLFKIEDKAKDSKYVTNDLNYYFVCKNDSAMTGEEDLITDFYNMLYNQICMNGACTDATKTELAMTDKEYLSNALKNGQLFISSLNNDGYFYQGHYTLNGHVTEVADEDAIARAELEYNVTKSKLNYKEETLEIQMKNLDTEISALSTEFDTVKNLISKGVEKVFTMFST